MAASIYPIPQNTHRRTPKNTTTTTTTNTTKQCIYFIYPGIDEKYDVAVSTASGALDFIVVETAKGGGACVEYLRKHNLGRCVSR